jgi:3-hydroxybutyryl-CoA dehydrogenase
VSVIGDERLSDRLRAAGVAVVSDGATAELGVDAEPSGERRIGVRHIGAHSLVELVRGSSSSPEAIAAARAAYAAIGVPAVVCSDRAGGIVDALLIPHLADAVRMSEDGYATPDQIDVAMIQGCGYHEGPFAALQRIGAARAVEVLEALYAESREPHLAPPRSLRRQATRG